MGMFVKTFPITSLKGFEAITSMNAALNNDYLQNKLIDMERRMTEALLMP